MKILTFNCCGVPLDSLYLSKRMRLIAKQINKLNPDLVFLQEVFLPWHKKVFVKILDGLPYHYLPRNGIFRTGGGLCCFSRYPIIKKDFYAFSKSGYWSDLTKVDKLVRKGFVRLKIKGPRTFYVFNTHLTANYRADYSLANQQVFLQKLQLNQLARGINRIPSKIPCLVVGDFNMPASADLFSDFLKVANCKDLTISPRPSVRNDCYILPAFLYATAHRKKVDYILFKGNRKTCRWKYVFNDKEALSDHLGILADITL